MPYLCVGSGILLSTGNVNGPWYCLATNFRSVGKVDLIKVLELFSYMQNYQSYGPGSVEYFVSLPMEVNCFQARLFRVFLTSWQRR